MSDLNSKLMQEIGCCFDADAFMFVNQLNLEIILLIPFCMNRSFDGCELEDYSRKKTWVSFQCQTQPQKCIYVIWYYLSVYQSLTQRYQGFHADAIIVAGNSNSQTADTTQTSEDVSWNLELTIWIPSIPEGQHQEHIMTHCTFNLFRCQYQECLSIAW